MLGFDPLLGLEISICSGMALSYAIEKPYVQDNGMGMDLPLD
jgi:hypothetical protein